MALDRRMTRLAQASPEAIAAAAACLRAGGLVAMPTETVYGLAADATSDAAVAAIYAAKERPAINPLIAHVLDIDAAREHAIFGPEAETLARAFWPGPLTLVLPVASTSRISLLARAGLDTRGDSLAVARNRAGSDRGGERPPSGAVGKPVWRREPDHGRSRRRRTRWQGRLDPRWRAMPPWSRIDDRRVSRRSAPIAASGRDNPRSDRIRARFADRLDERRGSRPERARAIGLALCAQDCASTSARRAPRRTKPRSISAARSRAARLARKSIFRRPQTLSRQRRICFPIFARWTALARRGSRSRRSRSMGLGRRSTIGSAVQLRRETK